MPRRGNRLADASSGRERLCPCCWPPWQCAPVVQRRGARPRTTFTGHAAAFALRRRGGPTSNAPYTAPGQYAVGHRPLAPWPRCLVTCWWWGGGCCEPRATTVSAVRGKRCFVRLVAVVRMVRFQKLATRCSPHRLHFERCILQPHFFG